MRDLMVVKIDPGRLSDPEIAAEGERDRLKALAASYSREDLMRAFDLLSKAETDIKNSSQPRHQFEMALVKWIHLRQLTPLTEIIQRSSRGSEVPGVPWVPGVRLALRVPLLQRLRVRRLGRRRSRRARQRRPRPSARTRARPKLAVPVVRAAPREPRRTPGTQGTPGTRGTAGTPEPRTARSLVEPDQISSRPSCPPSATRTKCSTAWSSPRRVIEIEGDAIVFSFAPVHRSLKTQLEGKRAWIEQLAHAASGRKMSVVVKERPAAAPTEEKAAAGDARKADLRERAKAEPQVQAVLDVFGGQIEDVEEIQ